MAIQARSSEYGVIHHETIADMMEEMKDDPKWYSVTFWGGYWLVKRKNVSWGFVEGLLEKFANYKKGEHSLYFVKPFIEPKEAFDRVIYRLALGEDISIESDYRLIIHEVLSVDEFVERFV
jgi:hypothetical protein